MCEDNERLAYLGPGYPLFFLFMKYAIGMLLMMFLVFGLYALSSNVSGSSCSNDPGSDDDSVCYQYVYLYLSMANKKLDSDGLNIQSWLSFASIVILIIMIQIMRRNVRKTASDCDERDISASDYTVMVEHIPIVVGVDYKKELKEAIENEAPFTHNGQQSKFEVCKINLTYNLEEFYK